MTTPAPKPLKIFCSYSHKDEAYLNELRTWLRRLERQGLVEWWHDRQIAPGWEWEEAIDKNLRSADIIFLLITPDFMGSDYVFEKEIDRAIERHERGETRVIPIIVRPADWQWAPLDRLQALPKDAKPITTWPNRDEAWLDVVKGIRRAIEELLVERQERAAAEERYRKAVDEAWADKKLSDVDAERLDALAGELSMSTDTSADIEREVMGDTVETNLVRQEDAAREEERNRRLEELYVQARQFRRNQEWQAVIDAFEQIRAEDPAYPDPEGLLRSARQSLEARSPQRHQTAERSAEQATREQPDYSADTQPQPPLSTFGGKWWALALAGVAIALLGPPTSIFASSSQPSIFFSLRASSLLIAIGVLTVVASSTAHPRLLLRTQGIISGLAGVVALPSGAVSPPYPPTDASSLADAVQSMPFFVIYVFAFALWGIGFGITQIIATIRLGWDFRVMRLMLVSGAFLVLYGIYDFSSLVLWINAIPWLPDILLLAGGMSLVALAFLVRKWEGREVGA
jgi:uncharacterized membrane protein HdeD (DUF308 family)